MQDYYAVLMLDPRAEQIVVEAAFRRLAREYHPDVYKEADAHERMLAINEAWEVLGNPVSRRAYDEARIPPQPRTASPPSPAPGPRTPTDGQAPKPEPPSRSKNLSSAGRTAKAHSRSFPWGCLIWILCTYAFLGWGAFRSEDWTLLIVYAVCALVWIIGLRVWSQL